MGFGSEVIRTPVGKSTWTAAFTERGVDPLPSSSLLPTPRAHTVPVEVSAYVSELDVAISVTVPKMPGIGVGVLCWVLATGPFVPATPKV
jgi:hypothetical protein